MQPRFLTGFIVLLCCIAATASASVRTRYTINESWYFAKGNITSDSQWEVVALPHTWNNVDADDEASGYFRGVGTYRRDIVIAPMHAGQQASIYFEGANQVVDVWVNGAHAGQHIGGYTRFCFDITNLIKVGQANTFEIRVDNAHNPDIPPLSADFTFFGGIYRDVYLQFTHSVHVSTSDYASSGVYITTPKVSADQARVGIKTLLSNNTPATVAVRLEHTLVDGQGQAVAKHSNTIKLKPGNAWPQQCPEMVVSKPQLWDVDHPYLYQVYTRLYEVATGRLIDEVSNPLGFRWFEFSATEGFLLNGRHVKLIGTNRHQDYYRLGNALRDEMHVRDVELLKQMGGNFLRVSHYPQDPVVMEMCDKLGIVTAVEIPVVNYITPSGQFARHCLEMAKEMIRQDYNRPSVVIWAYMNEVMLRPPYKDTDEQWPAYLQAVGQLGQQIEDLIRKEDPSRYTMIPFHGNPKAYQDAGLIDLPMVRGWNLYSGWYSGKFSGFDAFLDTEYQRTPAKPIIVTEYGADVDPRLHSFSPERFDFTAEYANLYHEHYLQAIAERNFVAGAAIWNLNDFYSEPRLDAVPHVNNKGITGVDREIKDTYLLYQAYLRPDPVLRIGSTHWRYRAGVANTQGVALQPVKVYSNLPEVALWHNGVLVAKQAVQHNVAEFDVPFVHGVNRLEAVATASSGLVCRDALSVDFQLIPLRLADGFAGINVMLGSNRYYEDRVAAMVWMPEQAYTPGGWGYVGGEPYRKKTRYGSQPSSELDILGTDDDPLFQTQRVGIQQFRADVPDGEYAIYFYWAELQAASEAETLAYNLGNDALQDSVSKRVFGVEVNKVKVFEGLNLEEQFGAGRAVIKKVQTYARNGQGIVIDFHKEVDQPVINAIRIYRMY